ncbi:MAG: hypothetical protein ABSG04_02855 [Verrucomicrobiota bacterium]|jgi:hypothetical protein
MSTYRNWFIAGVAAVCFVTGIALSHLIEPGVRVQKVTLAEDTPALKFLPAGPGSHPVALLAHGLTASKETLFVMQKHSRRPDLYAMPLIFLDMERRRVRLL